MAWNRHHNMAFLDIRDSREISSPGSDWRRMVCCLAHCHRQTCFWDCPFCFIFLPHLPAMWIMFWVYLWQIPLKTNEYPPDKLMVGRWHFLLQWSLFRVPSFVFFRGDIAVTGSRFVSIFKVRRLWSGLSGRSTCQLRVSWGVSENLPSEDPQEPGWWTTPCN